MSRLAPIALLLLLLAAVPASSADYDAEFNWIAAGAVGPVWDGKTQDGFDLVPGDYVGTVSLERVLGVLTVRTQVGGFFYGDEIPDLDRENGGFALLTAMDRFGEGRWAVLVLGGGGYYEASQDLDFHAGIGFDYRFEGPWIVRGEAIYHHEFESVALSAGIGYMF
jgi:hypothetical protein